MVLPFLIFIDSLILQGGLLKSEQSELCLARFRIFVAIQIQAGALLLEDQFKFLNGIVVLSFENRLEIADFDPDHARHEILVAEELVWRHREAVDTCWFH